MKSANNFYLLVGLSVLAFLGMLGCSVRNDYNLPIAIGLGVLSNSGLRLKALKITYILLGGTALVDLIYLKRFWSHAVLLPSLNKYSIVLTILEMAIKIVIIAALVLDFLPKPAANSVSANDQNLQRQRV